MAPGNSATSSSTSGRTAVALRLVAFGLLVLVNLVVFAPAIALAQPTPQDAGQTLSKATQDLQLLETRFEADPNAAEHLRLRERAGAIERTATAQVAELQPLLNLLDARVAQLGSPSPGTPEAPEIEAERRTLALRRSLLDSSVKRGNLVALEARQLEARIKQNDAIAFSRSLLKRDASPLTLTFWNAISAEAPHDADRARAFLHVEIANVGDRIKSGAAWWAVLGLVGAIGLVVSARIAFERIGQRFMIQHGPNTRLRRSGLAFWLAATGVLAPFLASIVFVASARGAGMVAPQWGSLGDALIHGVLIGGTVAALGEALLQTRLPSWRLVSLSNEAAAGLRPWSWVLAATAFASLMITELNDSIGASAPMSMAADLTLTVMHLTVTAAVLVAANRIHSRDLEHRRHVGEPTPPESPAVAVAVLATAAVVFVAAVLLLLGYVALGLMLARLLTWLPLIGASLYLLLLFTDDACTALFTPESLLSRAFSGSFYIHPRSVTQTGVALSALVRVGLLLTAVAAAFSPFGSHFDSLLETIGRLSQGITFGQVTLRPGAVLRAAIVLAAGLLAVRAMQSWLDNRYLPATEMDAGARNSVSTTARYAGLILTALWALASLGIGLERIALLLSALSVGIGFGLQAITQNFVSGLILLAERPVRIGDLVRLGDNEGDVKRIRVRSTEIGMADGATLIVPNSELITKSLLNKTHADPTGRVQIRLTVGLDNDIAHLRELVSNILAASDDVLEKPAPQVFFDEVSEGAVQLNCLAYVRSPRDVYPSRSELLYRVIVGLQAAGVDLAPPTLIQEQAKALLRSPASRQSRPR